MRTMLNQKEREAAAERVREKAREDAELWKEFCQEEDGVGVVEIILILVILIGLVLLFKENISKIVESAFKQINGDSKSIIN